MGRGLADARPGRLPRLAVVNLAGSMLAGVLLAWGGASLGSVLKYAPYSDAFTYSDDEEARVCALSWASTDRSTLLLR
jgi:hypothetical protein